MAQEGEAGRPRLDVEAPIDVRELRYFLAVADELNFTRAAARLHVAQQSLSAAISRMELALGVTLFERSTRHVVLTRAGEELVPAARRILVDLAEAIDRTQQLAAGRRERIVVGVAIAVSGLPVIRDSIRRFAELAPDIDLQVVGYDHGNPTAGLAAGASDVAFVLAPLTLDGYATLPVLREPRRVLLPADHPLAGRPEIRASDLAGLPWLRAPAPDGPWSRFWFGHPLGEPATGPEVRSGVEWLPAVQAGRGVGYTLASLAAGFLPADVVAVPVEDIEPGTVVLAWPKAASPTVKSFVATVRSTLPGRAQRT